MPRNPTVSRKHVVQVAGRLFYLQGIRATGVAQIAAEAGCGKQALYRLFPAKDDLVAAYLTSMSVDREASADRAMAGAGDDAAGRLVALIEEVAVRASRRGFRGCPMRNYVREISDENTEAMRVARRYLTASRQRVVELAKLAVPDDDLVGEKVWLVHEGLYSTSRHTPVGAGTGVELVRQLVGSGPA